MDAEHDYVYLAQISAYRFVTLCCRQTVHIYWDNLTLTWRLADFRQFVQLIRRQMQPQEATAGDFQRFAGMALSAQQNLELNPRQLNAPLSPTLVTA